MREVKHLYGWWGVIDHLSHRISFLLPNRVQNWICDKFDESLGITQPTYSEATATVLARSILKEDDHA